MDEIRRRGGARIGWVNASFPLASLSVTADRIEINGFLLGNYSFRPEEVVELKRIGIPVIYSGLRIVHSISSYPARIEFFPMSSVDGLKDQIEQSGFNPKGRQSAIPPKEGMAFRWPFVALAIIGWNLLFILDGFIFLPWRPPPEKILPGPFVSLALALVFLSALSILKSERFRSLALKPDLSVQEVGAFLRLILLVTGGLFIGIVFFAGAR